MIFRIIEIINESKKIFDREDELDFSYLFTHKSIDLPHLINVDRKISGAIVLSLFLFIRVTKLFILGMTGRKKHVSKNSVLIYSGSFNQKNTFSSIVDELDRHEISYIHYVNGVEFSKCKQDEILINIGLCEYIAFIYLTFSRGFGLFNKLNRLNKSQEIKFCFDQFLSAYYYVPIFVRIITEERPKLICFSNDHNVDTRALRSIAERFNIDTLYIQHATVTAQYPPLKFTYSMLDGENAVEVYKTIAQKSGKCFPDGKIFLSGQKKAYRISRKKQTKGEVGIAVNTLDELGEVLALLKLLTLRKSKFVVRCHPNQDDAFISILKGHLDNNCYGRISVAQNESLQVFLSGIDFLISSNSSIHIEAALNGISTIYYEFGEPKIRDYYKFVSNGISKEANGSSILNILDGSHLESDERKRQIKKYCQTYGTKWSGNEGKLIAEFICRIIEGKGYEDIFSLSNSRCVYKVVG